MRRRIALLRSLVAFTVVPLAAVTCDKFERVVGPADSPEHARLSIDISSADVAAGQQLAVAIGGDTKVSLGGIQAFLRFDPARLRV